MENKIYDIIILGATKEGIKTALTLNKKNSMLNIALISTNFDNVTKAQNLTNIVCVNKLCGHVEYWNRLFRLTLSTNGNLSYMLAKKLIIATGTYPNRLYCNGNKVPNTYYYPEEVSNTPINFDKAIVLGNDEGAYKLALAAKTRFKYVYLCSQTLDLNVSAKHLEKLEKTRNIAILPSCKITNFSCNKAKQLQSITLDTYDTIKCDAVFASIGRQSDFIVFGTKLSQFMNLIDGKADVAADCASTKVPNLFIIGDCAYGYEEVHFNNLIKSLTK